MKLSVSKFFFISESSKQICSKLDRRDIQLTNIDIGKLFCVPANTISYHLKKARDDNNGETKRNGRPFILTEEQINDIDSWVSSFEEPLKASNFEKYVETKFGIKLDSRQLATIYKKIGCELVDAVPIEENRYYCQDDKIDMHFEELQAFTIANDIPSSFVFNLDEEGHEEFSDAKKEKIVIKKGKRDKKKLFYPVSRKQDHATFLACIAADGTYLQPMLVAQRSTIEIALTCHNLGPDRIKLVNSETGFITAKLFDYWLSEVFYKYVQQKRELLNYQGVAILMLDGCTCHNTERLYEVCKQLNIKIIWLPSHSSHKTQPLDLGIFAIHKFYLRRDKTEDDSSQLVKRIVDLYNAWQKTATVENITSAFKCAGAYFIAGGPSNTLIKFSKVFATKVIDMNDEVKKTRSEQYLKSLKTRIKLDDYNTMIENPSPKIKKIMDQLKKDMSTGIFMPDQSSVSLKALLQAFVPIERVDINAPQEYFPTITEMRRLSFDSWCSLSFDERLMLEIRYAGLEYE